MPSPTAAQVAAEEVETLAQWLFEQHDDLECEVENETRVGDGLPPIGSARWDEFKNTSDGVVFRALARKVIERNADALAEREAAVRVEEQERLALMLPDEIIQAVHRLWEKDHLNDAIAAVRAETWEAAARIAALHEDRYYAEVNRATFAGRNESEPFAAYEAAAKIATALREAARG